MNALKVIFSALTTIVVICLVKIGYMLFKSQPIEWFGDILAPIVIVTLFLIGAFYLQKLIFGEDYNNYLAVIISGALNPILWEILLIVMKWFNVIIVFTTRIATITYSGDSWKQIIYMWYSYNILGTFLDMALFAGTFIIFYWVFGKLYPED